MYCSASGIEKIDFDLVLAGLDLLRGRDLFLARGGAARRPSPAGTSDRVGGVRGAGRRRLGLGGASSLGDQSRLPPFVRGGEVGVAFAVVDDLDVHLAEHRHDAVDLVGRGELFGQVLADLVLGEVAALPFPRSISFFELRVRSGGRRAAPFTAAVVASASTANASAARLPEGCAVAGRFCAARLAFTSSACRGLCVLGGRATGGLFCGRLLRRLSPLLLHWFCRGPGSRRRSAGRCS